MNKLKTNNAAEELNRLHSGIMDGMKRTVQDAIRAGDILRQVKEGVGHGGFIGWIDKNCEFSRQTAHKYMKLYEYRDKCISSGHLQEAYQITERLEADAKKTEHQKAVGRAKHYNETGEKLEGWRRETDDKLAKSLKESEERYREHIRRFEERAEKIKTEKIESEKNIGEAFDVLNQLSEQIEERVRLKERLRVSFEGMQDGFVDALMDYLEGLEDDQRRIETCYNIIKVCKGIAINLQATRKESAK